MLLGMRKLCPSSSALKQEVLISPCFDLTRPRLLPLIDSLYYPHPPVQQLRCTLSTSEPTVHAGNLQRAWNFHLITLPITYSSINRSTIVTWCYTQNAAVQIVITYLSFSNCKSKTLLLLIRPACVTSSVYILGYWTPPLLFLSFDIGSRMLESFSDVATCKRKHQALFVCAWSK